MKLKLLKVDTSNRDSHLRKSNGKYYFHSSNGSETELIGMHCKAYHSNDEYFFSLDIGHFTTKFIDVRISKEEFLILRNGEISFDELYDKYSTKVNANQ